MKFCFTRDFRDWSKVWKSQTLTLFSFAFIGCFIFTQSTSFIPLRWIKHWLFFSLSSHTHMHTHSSTCMHTHTPNLSHPRTHNNTYLTEPKHTSKVFSRAVSYYNSKSLQWTYWEIGEFKLRFLWSVLYKQTTIDEASLSNYQKPLLELLY